MTMTKTFLCLALVAALGSAGNVDQSEFGATSSSGTVTVVIELASLNGGAAGTMELELYPKWSPLGVKRFIKLVQIHFFDQCRFFRVIPGFVAQFGIQGDPAINKEWEYKNIKDDPVLHSNKRATVVFADAGPDTRSTQLFINFRDNAFLDKSGFSPIGKVTVGMDKVDAIYPSPDGPTAPRQGQINSQGNAYLKSSFPKLSYIKKAYIKN